MTYDYDMIIVGGGPGGATAALYAERLGLKVLLVDKNHFPRDKVCGDAISGKSVVYLQELGLIEALEASPQEFIDSVIFSSPNNKSTYIKLIPMADTRISTGYVCRRMVFDNIMFQAAKEKVETLENFRVCDLVKPNGKVQGVKGILNGSKEIEYSSKVVIGADGFNSIVARKLNIYEHDPEHIIVATRAYYSGVTDLAHSIEIHFSKAVLPGYFWIFPLENGQANVGLGMIKSALKKKKIKLKKAHMDALESPAFKHRFKNAKLLGEIQGWNLPVGSKQRSVHGDGFLLIGDAAGLIDPFTGEGIGNAMCSGKIAAHVVAKLNLGNDFSRDALNLYQKKLWQTLGSELKLSFNLQRTARFTPLVNLVVSRSNKNPNVNDWIAAMIAGTISKRDLLKPATYLKLLNK